jgi:short-subunit dehydrogenase
MLDAHAQVNATQLQGKYGTPTDKAAEKTVRAIEKDKLRVIVGIDAHIGEFAKRLFPMSFQRLIGLFFR